MLRLNKINPFEKYMELVNVDCFHNNYYFEQIYINMKLTVY